MRSIAVFIAGVFVGSVIQGLGAQPRPEAVMLNHVAIGVPNLDEGIKAFTSALGAKEAFTFRDNRGWPFSYLQLSRNTFLELQPAGEGRPVGFLHIGLEVQDLRQALPRLRAAGLTVTDPAESPRTKALISQAKDPNGLRFEVLEFGPDTLQRKAMDSWK